MKKLAIAVVIISMLATTFAVGTLADEQWPLSIRVNNEEVVFPDAQPFVDGNGRTQVPVRFVSEALEASVEWLADTRQVKVTKEDAVILLTIDVKEMTINGQVKALDSAPLILESRTFVPIRFVSEALGAKIDWEAITNTVFIETGSTLASDGPQKIQAGSITIGDFSFNVADGDNAFSDIGRKRVFKESGFSFAEESDDIISVQIETEDSSKFEIAIEEARQILSQKLEAKNVEQILNFAKEAYSGKGELIIETFDDAYGKLSLVCSKKMPLSLMIYKGKKSDS